MSSNKFLSPIEHKIVLGFAFFICLTFFLHCYQLSVSKYNESVLNEEIHKMANHSGISFSVDYVLPPDYTSLFVIQFFTNLLLIFLIWKQSLFRLICSTTLTAITTISLLNCIYVSWNYWFKIFHFSNLDEIEYNQTFFQYLKQNSQLLLPVLTFLFFVFFILQTFVLIRFAIQKFQAKISLR